MSATLAMETRRMTTLPAVWYLALIAIGLGALVSAFVASTPDPGPLSIENTHRVLTGGSSSSLLSFVGLPLLFAALTSVTEDTRHKLASVLLVAQPRRARLMAARLVLLTGIALVAGLVQMPLSLLVSVILGRIPEPSAIPAAVPGHLLALVALTWAGAALGWITGSAAAAVGVVLADLLFIEPMAAVAGNFYSRNDLENYTRYLPFTAARDAVTLDPVGLITTTLYVTLLLTGAWLMVRTRDY
ncbi:hypothetical protein [Kineosporia succinea]|uniref:ABC-2 type transport system permease protein n=1 Tax=Kineosporia succinea TaxID=84632 RepID=A0ABT9P6X0_9ACTN|nr:hypothetical protein [Kineosporia succinea]MDP9828438.1 hypothetical protein [Kineosporia succinea]